MVIIVEQESDWTLLETTIKNSDSFWIPGFSDSVRHYICNTINWIYVYVIDDDIEFIIPTGHPDGLTQDKARLLNVLTDGNIYILGKKRLVRSALYKSYDADLFTWWNTNKPLDLSECSTTAHDIWYQWWPGMKNSYNWFPLTKHIERCHLMKNEFMKVYANYDMTDEYKRYDADIHNTFSFIETAGIHVDINKFKVRYDTKLLNHSRVYSEYNPYTMTGRPSNKFGGINFAALNKEDGTREMIKSRFKSGILLELDYDSYHPRLISKLIGYDLPKTSVHEYFGKQFYDTNELTTEQYEQTKQLVFHSIYGGISDELSVIPYFDLIRKYTGILWKEFKTNKEIKTPIYNRSLNSKNLNDMSATKLFNYLIQSYETETNMQRILQLKKLIESKECSIVLYTYDSILLDISLTCLKEYISDIYRILTNNNEFPMKITAGNNYNEMKDVTSRLSKYL